MNEQLFDVFSYLIRQSYPDATNIRLPGVVGAQKNVLFADINGVERVFKFGDPELIDKNVTVSKIYSQYGIRAPKITKAKHDYLYCEEYNIIPGTTLYQAVREGIDSNQIRDIYFDVVGDFALMRKISNIPLDSRLMYVHNLARMHVSGSTKRSVLGDVFGAATYLLNAGPGTDTGLYHFDITPKNIIVGPDGRFAGLVDMDSVGVCNKNFAFGVMASKYQEIGMNPKDLIDCYSDISSDTLARGRVLTTAQINSIVKKMLWKRAQRQQRQK